MTFEVGVTSTTMQQVTAIGEKLAKFGLTKAEQFYPYLVKNAFLTGIVPIGFFIFALVLIGIAVVLVAKTPKNENGNTTDTDTIEFALALGFLIVGCVIGVISMMTIATDNSFVHIFNPQYYAIKDLISMLK